MDDGFMRVDADLRALGARIDGLEARMDSRFDALQRTMIQVGGGMTATVLAALVSVIITQG
jgi:hypothetical protein